MDREETGRKERGVPKEKKDTPPEITPPPLSKWLQQLFPGRNINETIGGNVEGENE